VAGFRETGEAYVWDLKTAVLASQRGVADYTRPHCRIVYKCGQPTRWHHSHKCHIGLDFSDAKTKKT
jgi:hypothetical protein